jgi:hypothetical protein
MYSTRALGSFSIRSEPSISLFVSLPSDLLTQAPPPAFGGPIAMASHVEYELLSCGEDEIHSMI